MSLKAIPLSNKIFVQPDKKKFQTESGIFIPETVGSEAPRTGVVVAVGSGNVMLSSGSNPDGEVKWAKVPVEVEVGDTIAFPPIDYVEFEENGVNYLVISEEQIIFKVKKEN